jgi:hypothetical protein
MRTNTLRKNPLIYRARTLATILGTVILAAHVAIGQTTASQTTGSPSPQRHTQRRYRRPSLDEQVKSFSKALDLDETQQAGVKTILEREQMQARRIQFDQSLSGDDRIGRFRALQQATVLRIRALLNPDQKKKYDPLNHGTQTSSPQPSVADWLKATQH